MESGTRRLNTAKMTTAIIQLGKIGDILNAVPIAQELTRRNGEPPYFVVSRQYAHILDRIPNVEPVIYEGVWDDLSGAIKWAKRQFEKVIVTQTYGKDMPIEHRCSSWQLDAYERAGMLELWDKLTLEIPRDENMDAVCHYPTILLADHSESSPFFQKEELYAILRDNFPLHCVIRLSDYKLHNFCDFVNWYDKNEAIVCVESAHLHLTRATKTPVVALAADKPSQWNGSAWSKRYAFHCRYSDFDQRKGEMIEALANAMDGVRKRGAVVV